jgi:acetyltransferase
MSIRNLDRLFRPRSVAVIGATERTHSVGSVLTKNLMSGGFNGPLFAVNPASTSIHGLKAWPNVAVLPETPDLAVIATPPSTVPSLVAELAARGTRAAVIITAGFGEGDDKAGCELLAATLNAARPYTLRVVGPNCVGVLVPSLGLNASFAHLTPTAGGLAFVTQSGAVATAVMDWAQTRAIGFSHIVSMGTMADVDFGDMLDWLAQDPACQAVLLYVEAVTHARKFMSAARACARLKPVIVVKAGRYEEGARAARSHTGALAGSDAVYDAAFRRAGMLRVLEVDELFAAAETLAKARPIQGERLSILTNGGGFGVLAADALTSVGGRLATLAPETIAALNKTMPRTWSHGNPVDIIGDANPERYNAALSALLLDPDTDAVLVLNCPTAVASSTDAARAVASLARGSTRPVLTSWIGDAVQREARAVFSASGVPTFDTPESAVRAFHHMVDYRRNQEVLRETPKASSTPDVDRAGAQTLLAAARNNNQEWLSAGDARALLACYRILVNPTLAAVTPEDAGRAAAKLGVPIALKINSPDVVHKSDVGGVVLDLAPADVVAAARRMASAIAKAKPGARIEGFTLEPMVHRPGAIEIIAGIASDPDFGPVILFGEGGTRVELVADRAIGLPPLNDPLACDLIGRAKIARALAGFRGTAPADLDALSGVLIRLSELAVDCPEVAELDINPLLVSSEGVIALDARVRLQDPARATQPAISPYPHAHESAVQLPDGSRLWLRPARPDNEALLAALFAKLSPQDVRLSAFSSLAGFSQALAARLTQIDYDRELALIATTSGANGPEAVGIGHLLIDPDRAYAEYGVIIRSDAQGHGIGTALTQALIGIARGLQIKELFARIQAENLNMIGLATAVGFVSSPVMDGVVRMSLELNKAAAKV